MNQSTPYTSTDRQHAPGLVVQLLTGLLLVALVPVVLWVLTDPATALLTVTAIGAAGLLVVGLLGGDATDENRTD